MAGTHRWGPRPVCPLQGVVLCRASSSTGRCNARCVWIPSKERLKERWGTRTQACGTVCSARWPGQAWGRGRKHLAGPPRPGNHAPLPASATVAVGNLQLSERAYIGILRTILNKSTFEDGEPHAFVYLLGDIDITCSDQTAAITLHVRGPTPATKYPDIAFCHLAHSRSSPHRPCPCDGQRFHTCLFEFWPMKSNKSKKSTTNITGLISPYPLILSQPRVESTKQQMCKPNVDRFLMLLASHASNALPLFPRP